MSSVENKILHFYKKTTTNDGSEIYSTLNPVSIFEILYHLKIENYYQKYEASNFCKTKHEQLNKSYYGYTFHSLTKNEMTQFIDEVTNM